MKKYTVVFAMTILFSLLVTIKTTYAQWEGVYCAFDTVLPIKFNEIYFVNQSIGFGITDSLSLYKTIDTGLTWNYINTPPNLHDIVFINNSTGFIVGDNGISKTTNQGSTWTNLNVNFDSVMFIDFPSSNVGYTISYNGILAKTVNSGNNWNIVDTLNISPWFSAVFPNDNMGFICNGTNILKSDNGGVSWTQQTINSNGGVSNICFPSDSIGYCYHHFGGNSIDTLYLFKTIDAGTTWFLKSSVYAMNFITDMTFTNDTTGYFAGFFQVQNTIDGGTTWQYQNSTGICNDFFDNSYDLFFLDNNHGFMAGGFGAGEFYRIDKGGEVISTIDIVEKHQLNLKIYPNPTSGFVSIEYNQRKKATINIFNISGQLIHSEILSGNTTKQLDLSNFSKGVYLIKISNDEMIETQKLVVE